MLGWSVDVELMLKTLQDNICLSSTEFWFCPLVVRYLARSSTEKRVYCIPPWCRRFLPDSLTCVQQQACWTSSNREDFR